MREESVGQLLQSEVVPVGVHGEVADYLPWDTGLVAILDVVCSSTKKPKKLFIGGYEVEVTGLELRYIKSLEQEFSLTAALSACT